MFYLLGKHDLSTDINIYLNIYLFIFEFLIWYTNTTFINIFIFKILCSIKEEEFGHGASYISPKLRKRNQLSNSDSDDDWDRGIYIYIYVYCVLN